MVGSHATVPSIAQSKKGVLKMSFRTQLPSQPDWPDQINNALSDYQLTRNRAKRTSKKPTIYIYGYLYCVSYALATASFIEEKVHGQVLITSWVVISILLGLAAIAVRDPQTIPSRFRISSNMFLNSFEMLVKLKLEKNMGALLPLKIIQLPHGELVVHTNDISTTVVLALLTPMAYFYAVLAENGLGYVRKYIQPTPILLPINILEDFRKPLSLSFQLFRNILTDELEIVFLFLQYLQWFLYLLCSLDYLKVMRLI
ncbi:hypothetical protein M9H77_21871 [Catharanthus roseus]|uniref:Uncharacterized protein n=1 Tax=Catharanthus roseus TaxID=4058 RepID=A0ACC0ANK2_CATRO|nr:hypothetical protein M9H77_21871 [Catharanthus roseus]